MSTVLVVTVFGDHGSDIFRLVRVLADFGMPKPFALCARMAMNTVEE